MSRTSFTTAWTMDSIASVVRGSCGVLTKGMLKGSSMMCPISSIARKAQDVTARTGGSSHGEPGSTSGSVPGGNTRSRQRAVREKKGIGALCFEAEIRGDAEESSPSQTVRKREVCREYDKGTGVVRMRSQIPRHLLPKSKQREGGRGRAFSFGFPSCEIQLNTTRVREFPLRWFYLRPFPVPIWTIDGLSRRPRPIPTAPKPNGYFYRCRVSRVEREPASRGSLSAVSSAPHRKTSEIQRCMALGERFDLPLEDLALDGALVAVQGATVVVVAVVVVRPTESVADSLAEDPSA